MMDEDQVNDIIQRWRTTPEDNLKPEDYNQFKSFGTACLTEGNSTQLLHFLQDEKNQVAVLIGHRATRTQAHRSFLSSSSSSYFPAAQHEHVAAALCLQASGAGGEEKKQADRLYSVRSLAPLGIVKSMGCVLLAPLVKEAVKKQKSLDHCQAALTHLIRTCSPDELLQSILGLTGACEPGAISGTILVLAPHLQTVLLCVGETKAACVGLALSTLQEQLSRLPVPYSEQQEEADEYGLCRCCHALAVLTKPFIEEVTRKKGNYCSTAEGEELRSELLQFCMRSLRDPLLEAELSRDRASPLRLFATEIMVTLPALQESLSELLLRNSLKKSSQSDNRQSKESRACLAYLLFVQLITIDSFPAVFSPAFVLQCNMEHIDQLLSSKKESHLLKGLALGGKSLESVQDNSLPVSLLGLKSFYSVPQSLRHVLTDCPMPHLSKSALQVLQLFINKLDAEAKHKFFRCMLKTSDHVGIQSYIVKAIRNQVDFSMQPGNGNKWFLGEEFLSLLRLVLCLPHGADTDLLNSMDRIMESLNLLRYLLLREVRSPYLQADVWEEVCRIKDEYLRILRVCIGISRAYYSAELKALREDQKLKAKESKDAVRSTASVKSIKVKHERVSNMSPEVHHQVLQSALVTFDLMESLVVRIEEITEEKRRIPNQTKAACAQMYLQTSGYIF